MADQGHSVANASMTAASTNFRPATLVFIGDSATLIDDGQLDGSPKALQPYGDRCPGLAELAGVFEENAHEFGQENGMNFDQGRLEVGDIHNNVGESWLVGP